MKRHPFDPLSFLFGVLFLVVGLSFALAEPGVQAARPVRLWPVAGVVVGMTITIWAVARARRRPAAAPEGPTAPIDEGREPTAGDDQAEGPRP